MSVDVQRFATDTAVRTYTSAEIDALISALATAYIKLDFSNIPASPVTDGFATNGADTIEFWVNGSLRQSWTTAIVCTGKPIGLLLSLTYP